MFNQAGLDISKEASNKVSVIGHKEPHPKEYHLGVFRSLNEVTEGLEGDAYTKALQTRLAKLGVEIATPGTEMNDMVTKQGAWQRSRNSNKDSGTSGRSNKSSSSISQERRNDNRSKH